MKRAEISPNWLPGTWARKVYLRSRPLKTPSAMAMVIQSTRFCLSTFSASGVAMALGLAYRHVRLGLRVPRDGLDLVLAQHAALLVDHIEGDLGPDAAGNRAR